MKHRIGADDEYLDGSLNRIGMEFRNSVRIPEDDMHHLESALYSAQRAADKGDVDAALECIESAERHLYALLRSGDVHIEESLPLVNRLSGIRLTAYASGIEAALGRAKAAEKKGDHCSAVIQVNLARQYASKVGVDLSVPIGEIFGGTGQRHETQYSEYMILHMILPGEGIRTDLYSGLIYKPAENLYFKKPKSRDPYRNFL